MFRAKMTPERYQQGLMRSKSTGNRGRLFYRYVVLPPQ